MNATITYDYYRIFHAVAQCKSFTRAAELLDNNQPNITRVMNNLEDELGCKLFVRSNRGITLTPEGERLYEHVAVAYEQLKMGEEELRRDVSLESGIVTIAASESALHLLLLDKLSQFHEMYPGVHLRIYNYTSPQAVGALEKGLIDCAVITAPVPTRSGLRSTPIFRFREILIGGTKFRHLTEDICRLRDIESCSLVCLSPGTSTFAFYQKFFLTHDCTFRVDMEAATMDQVLPMVRHNLGIGFYSETLAAEAIARQDVGQIRLVEPIPERAVCLVEDTSRHQGPAVKRLLAMIRAAAGGAGKR